MAKVIMIQGTMSNAGKSLLVTGLCRIFKQDGYRVSPFKSQNMALNSYITRDGFEIGRAQAVQAEAAGVEPSVWMNPVLLKPNSDTGSQVIVNGKVRCSRNAKEYYAEKRAYIPDVLNAYHRLEEEYDLIVIEGAGSPAEINLMENDFVNMGLAELVDAPVFLVGDIDRGGVFAQLYGTVKLLDEKYQRRIKGLVINKFRGDVSILEPGLVKLEQMIGLPVVGVLPYVSVDIDDEDSLSGRLTGSKKAEDIDIAVIRLPRLSNFTDFSIFERMEGVSLRYVERVSDFGSPDMVILPGSKSTVADLLWMRQNGLEARVLQMAHQGRPVFGICGGYQMLGKEICDSKDGAPEGRRTVRGMDLLPVETMMEEEKTTRQVRGRFGEVQGILRGLSGMPVAGYEIHHGRTRGQGLCIREDGTAEGSQAGNIYGTYLHGIFDEAETAEVVIRSLLKEKGSEREAAVVESRTAYRERQYDLLAETIRQNLDMEAIYQYCY